MPLGIFFTLCAIREAMLSQALAVVERSREASAWCHAHLRLCQSVVAERFLWRRV